MANFSEDNLVAWTKPPSDSEATRCVKAESMIRDAISADPVLSGKDVRVFAQGSYKNKTNVRLNSDVDVCVCLMSTIFSDIPDGTTREDYGLRPSSYTFKEFRDRVQTALNNKFGSQYVDPGNKSFKIENNTNRVDADVVPCFEHRRYEPIGASGQISYESGTELRPRDGGRVINWPHQHYENGVNKNTDTSRRFKRLARILKRVNYKMIDDGIISADAYPSFFIECLAWNVPDNVLLQGQGYLDIVADALVFLYDNTKDPDLCDEWGEVSELKYLFRGTSKWTKTDAKDFAYEVWNYLGF